MSVTTCNEISREHFTVAAVVYSNKQRDIGSVQANPAAGNKENEREVQEEKCRSALVTGAEFVQT